MYGIGYIYKQVKTIVENNLSLLQQESTKTL